MKRRPEESMPEENTNAWMATYSDMVTLLFTFFVLLFAISQIDVQKFNLLVVSLSNKGATPEQIMELGQQYNLHNEDPVDVNDPRIPLPVGEAENPLLEAYENLVNYVGQSNADDKVEISLGNDYIFIRFMDDILFDPNSARIRQKDYALLSFIGDGLKTIENDIALIRIDGHTASVLEQEDYPVSDRILSSERANSVLMYFEDVVGIQPDKLAAFSLGKQRPIASNETEEGRAQNRRIEILVTQSSLIDIQMDNIYDRLYE